MPLTTKTGLDGGFCSGAHGLFREGPSDGRFPHWGPRWLVRASLVSFPIPSGHTGLWCRRAPWSCSISGFLIEAVEGGRMLWLVWDEE